MKSLSCSALCSLLPGIFCNVRPLRVSFHGVLVSWPMLSRVSPAFTKLGAQQLPVINKMEYLVYYTYLYRSCRNIFGRKIASNCIGNENKQTDKILLA